MHSLKVNTDSAGNTLTEQQQEYFKDSKVRDDKGALMMVYHQTDADFTEFRTKSEGAGKYDGEMPDGIFTKPEDNDIGMKGKKTSLTSLTNKHTVMLALLSC